MEKYFALILTTIFFALPGQLALAQELVEMNRSVRALGMGDAFTAIATGHDAIFYNPAGLAKDHGLSWEIIDFQIGADGENVYQTYQNFNSSGGYVPALESFFGQHIWIGGGGKTSLTIGNVGFAYYDSAYLSAGLSNPALPLFDIKLINDTGMAAGVGFDIAPGLSWGVTGREVSRFGSTVPVGVVQLISLNMSNLQNQIDNQGVGYALDTGFLYTLPGTAKPTLSFTWKDLGVTSFKPLTTVGPPPQQDEMDLGLGLEIQGPLFTLRPSIEVQELNMYDQQLGKKLHAGVELSLPLIDLRAGLYQGYYTAGVGVNLGFLKVDAATYEVEQGVYPGQDGDRRYIVEATLILSFDPDFSFLNTSGKRAIIERR